LSRGTPVSSERLEGFVILPGMTQLLPRRQPSPYASRLRLCSREVVLAIALTLGAVGLLIVTAST
jgi:hypothetical protein